MPLSFWWWWRSTYYYYYYLQLLRDVTTIDIYVCVCWNAVVCIVGDDFLPHTHSSPPSDVCVGNDVRRSHSLTLAFHALPRHVVSHPTPDCDITGAQNYRRPTATAHFSTDIRIIDPTFTTTITIPHLSIYLSIYTHRYTGR